MREIKFRAWNGEMMSKPFSPTDLTVTEYRSWIDNDGVSVAWPTENGSCNNWMQYTGLKDKNGVEIYEGDIVDWNNGVGGWSRFKSTRAVVEWDKANPCFVLKDMAKKENPNYQYDFVCCGYASIEVIGNIHENPELLK